jgi:hypothetical protein
MRLDHGAELRFKMVHGLIEIVELRVPQHVVVHEIPLAATVRVAVAITFSWEIDPLWVTKFVTHEVEISLSTK